MRVKHESFNLLEQTMRQCYCVGLQVDFDQTVHLYDGCARISRIGCFTGDSRDNHDYVEYIDECSYDVLYLRSRFPLEDVTLVGVRAQLVKFAFSSQIEFSHTTAVPP